MSVMATSLCAGAVHARAARAAPSVRPARAVAQRGCRASSTARVGSPAASSSSVFGTAIRAGASRARAVSLAGFQVRAEAVDSPDVIVVGAGVAGLAAATTLSKAGTTTLVLEAADAVGGRVRTDEVDGFLLDRGFQIFLTAYPTAQEMLDYEALDLQEFYAGSFVRFEGEFHRVADPFRHLVDGLMSLPNPVGTVLDKVNVGLLRFKTLFTSLDEIFAAEETTIEGKLKQEGFSDAMIDRFFRPFMGGIWFDRSLGTSSRLLMFVLRMLATGSNCLPAGGIGAVATQLAARMPEGSIKCDSPVAAVVPATDGAPAYVQLADGTKIEAPKGVVVAVDGPAASQLLGDKLASAPSKSEPGVGTCNLYYKAPSVPLEGEPILYLDGEGNGIVNNMCFPSSVAPTYAPKGQHLVSVSTIGTFDEMTDEELSGKVKAEMTEWFGASEVDGWELLKIYRIPFAQPNQAPPTNFSRPVDLGDGVYVCGDHRESASLEGALASGQRVAATIMA